MIVLVMSCIIWIPNCHPESKKVFPIEVLEKKDNDDFGIDFKELDFRQVNNNQQQNIIQKNNTNGNAISIAEKFNHINKSLSTLPSNVNFLNVPTTTTHNNFIDRNLNEEEVLEYYENYIQHQNFKLREKAIRNIKYKNIIQKEFK